MSVQTSRSVVVEKFGGYNSLKVEYVDLPELDENVEITVDYGGLNFADLYTRQGLMQNKKLPFVLGIECTGRITAIGSKNTELKVGQRVVCYDYTGGMYRDRIRVNPEKCYVLPEFIDSKIGAAVFVNYLTAYFALFGLGNLKEGEKVLILSCAGGVGCAATQLAKTVKNVEVFGTGTSLKEPEVKRNGVDIFFSNDSFEIEAKPHKFDVIITNQAGSMFTFLQNLLNPLGRIIILGANNIIQNEHKLSIFTLLKAWWTMKHISPESLITNNRIVAGLHLGTLIEKDAEKVRKALNYIFELYKSGKISPIIHSVWPMEEIIDATRILGERKNVGKVLIDMSKVVKNVS